MKKLLSVIVIIAALCVCGVSNAENTAYQTRNMFSTDDSVMCIACANGMLYALRNSGLYQIKTDETETQMAPAGDLDERMYTILSDGNAVYGLVSDGTLILYLLVDESGSFVNRCLFETDMFADTYLQNPVVKNNTLFFLYSSGKQTEIVACSLATEETATISLTGILCFDVMEDGQIIALQRETHWPDTITSLLTIAPSTSETEIWAEIDTTDSVQQIVYDCSTDTVYLFGRSEIFACTKGSDLTTVDTFIAGDVISTALLPSGAALIVDDSLIIRNFSTTDSSAIRRLTLLEPYGRGEEYRDFLEANPDVDLVFVDSGEQSGEDRFVQDMTTHNADIDIYILSDTNLLNSIKQKGFFVDMAQSPEIKSLTDQMYEPFRQALTLETQIVAFPKETFFEILCYHKETFQALGIPLPETYADYFDFCLAWLDSYADTYPDITLNPFANSISLETLLARYADELARSNETIAYQTDTVKRTLENYLAVQSAMKTQDTQSSDGTPLFYSYSIPCLGTDDSYEYLPLTFEAGASIAISPQAGDFSYFVINPYSANAQDALALIASYDTTRSGTETALLYRSTTSAIENEFYQRESTKLQEVLRLLEAAYATADSDARNELEAQIAAQKEQIADYQKENEWAVSQSAITFYKEHAGWLYINSFNPFTSLLDSLGSAELNFLEVDETTDIDALLMELDRRIHMMMLEEGLSS